jgi:thioredoxin 1
MANVLDVTETNFDQEVKNSDVPVLVDFWAPWCGPCKALSPVIDELAQDYQGKVKIVKVNTDENVGLAQQYRISGIPCLLIFKNGQQVEQLTGNQRKSVLVEMLNKHLN